MRVVVCPAHAVSRLCEHERPSHAVSLVSPGDIAPALPSAVRRLTLVFNDIAEPHAGLVLASAADVDALLRFARGWNGEQPLLVHCSAGISRSTAAAFAIACERAPARPENAIAHDLRRASPHATPNQRLVALADACLGRGGRMIEAAASLGRGADWAPDPTFCLDLAAPVAA